MLWTRLTYLGICLLMLSCFAPGQNSTQRWQIIDINQIRTYVSEEGTIGAAGSSSPHSYGFFYPKELTTYLAYISAFMIGAEVDSQPCVSLAHWDSDFQPGTILTDSTFADPSDRSFRVYKLLKNWEYLREGTIKDGYRKDYNEWPDFYGAPLDAGGTPLQMGDMTLWMVTNDLDTNQHFSNYRSYGTMPLGAEVQTTVWAYKDIPELTSVLFVKRIIINKSKKVWQKVYIGNHLEYSINSDFAGCDTNAQIGYGYSARKSSNRFGEKIPAMGFVLLQGPMIPSAGGTAYQNGASIPNFADLPMTAFVRFSYNNSSEYWPITPIEWYNTLRGFWSDGSAIMNPQNGKRTSFTFPGDPVTETGWTETSGGYSSNYREGLVSTGPFTMAPGDTQEVVGAFVIGLGANNLESINVLRYYARFSKSFFENGMRTLEWEKPRVGIAQLPNRIILDWSTNAEMYHQGYSFQGYTVCQGETEQGPWHEIALYDNRDNLSALWEESFSPAVGYVVRQPKYILPNLGIRRFIEITRDSIRQTSLINGTKYYFAVRAFAYNEAGRPMIAESPMEGIVAIPQSPIPGSTISETNSLVPHTRPFDDGLKVRVINPYEMKNKNFKVAFSISQQDTLWSLFDITENKTLFSLQHILGSDLSYPIVDGFTPQIIANKHGVRRDFQVPQGWEYFPPEHRFFTSGTTDLFMDAMSIGLTWPNESNYMGRPNQIQAHDLKRVEIRFNTQQPYKAYRYLSIGHFLWPIKDSSFLPFIKIKGPNYSYQDFVDIPLSAWEIDPNDGDTIPRQLAVAFVETNDSLYNFQHTYVGRGNINGKWDPTTANNGGGEMLYILGTPYADLPQTPWITKNLLTDTLPVLYVLWCRADSTLRSDKKTTFDDGDRMIIQPNYPLAAGRVFEFETSAPIIGNTQKAKEENILSRTTVYPNPYLGGHREESTPLDRFITFNHLPAECTIMIFTLSGTHIKTIKRQGALNEFERWDLKNQQGVLVASGIYLAHIDAPGIGITTIKLAVLMSETRMKTY